MNEITKVVFLSMITYAVVEHLFKPIRDKIPANLKPYTPYVSMLAAGLLVFFSHINLAVDIIPNPLLGRILTAIVASCGSEMIDFFRNIPMELLKIKYGR